MLHFFWLGFEEREHSFTRYEVANHEIAKWAEFYLSQYTSFHQAHCRAGRVSDRPDDILLGHPTWDDFSNPLKRRLGEIQRDWVKDNALAAGQPCHPNTYILMPWQSDFIPEWTASMPFHVSQLLSARKIFAICGDFWLQKTLEKADESIEAQVKNKLIRLNMCVANQNFPSHKTSFNPIGARRALHISDLKHHKGFDITCESLYDLDIMLGVGSVHLSQEPGPTAVEISDGKIYVFEFLGGINNLDPDRNDWIIENFDFYIHTARVDAQATTVLENIARGLIPMVTPESGFSHPQAIALTLDPGENRKIIEWAINLPEAELLERSRLLRQHIATEHSWEKLFGKIWSEITADMASRNAGSA
jgi:hypothetical protein